MSENNAFGCSYKHCFHVVRSCRWSKLWSSPFRWDMDAIRKSRIRLRKNSFSAVITPYISTIVCYSSVVHDELNAIYRIRIAVCKRLLSPRKICFAAVKENARRKKLGFIFEKVLDFLSLLWYVARLTGGATYEKYNQRTMAWKHNSARG